MKRAFEIVCFLFVFSSFGWAQSTYTIFGRALDATGKEPLPGTNIAIKNTAIGTVCDEKGLFVLENLKPGNYELSASFIGYKTVHQQISINHQNIELTFLLEEDSNLLNEVVVTGTGTEHFVKQAPVRTEVINRKTLDAYAGRSLEDILSGISASFDFNQGTMGSNIKLNGLGNSYILILINGKKIHGDVGGQNDLGLINPASIDRIEVVKGAASSLYGSDAIAGVINIITKKNHSLAHFENNTRIGSYADVVEHLSLGLKVGKVRFTLQGDLKHSDGWQNTKEEIFGRSKRLYTNSVTKTANRFTDYKITPRIDFSPSASHHYFVEGYYYGKKMYRPCGEPQYSTYGMRYESLGGIASGKWKFGSLGYIEADVSYDRRDYLHYYTGISIEEYVSDDGEIHHPVYDNGDESLQSKQERYLSNVKTVLNPLDNHQINLGLELSLNRLSAPYRIEKDNVSAFMGALYAQDEFSISKHWQLTGGFRIINHEAFGWKMTPQVSSLWKLGVFNLRASYAQGFKTPTLKELYYKYERTMMAKLRRYEGNLDLDPQRSHYYSVGFEYNTEKLTFNLTGYYNSLKDMIALVIVPTTIRNKARGIDETMQYANMESATSKGFDVMTKWQPNKQWQFSLGYGYNDAQGDLLNEDKIIERMHLDGTGFHQGKFHGQYNKAWKKYKLAVALSGKALSKRFHHAYGNADGYMSWRINTNHKLTISKTIKIDMNIGIDNIFDYYEKKPHGYNYATKTPGRTYYASLAFKFNR